MNTVTLPVDGISSAVTSVGGQMVDLVTANLPIILGVTAAFVGLSVARGFIKRLAS